MSYYRSKYGNIVHQETGTIVPMDESSEMFAAFQSYLSNGGEVPQTDNIADSEAVSEIAPRHLLALQELVIDLRIRAKAAAIDKTGPNGYIVGQEEMYRLKYRIAKGEITNAYIETLMQDEASEFGISFSDFKALVIDRYESAESTYNTFLYMIERCRTKIQTLVENANWTSVAQAFVLARSIRQKDQAEPIASAILAL